MLHAQTASKQGRHAVQAATAHDYVQQINSRDKIIAELRARQQAMRGGRRAMRQPLTVARHSAAFQ